MRRSVVLTDRRLAVSAQYLPRTRGQSDLQGIWSNATITPLERPGRSGRKADLHPGRSGGLRKTSGGPQQCGSSLRQMPKPDVTLGYNQFWYDRGTKVVGTPSNVADRRSAGRAHSRADAGSAEARAGYAAVDATSTPPMVRRAARSGNAAFCGPRRVRPCCRVRTTIISKSCRRAIRW